MDKLRIENLKQKIIDHINNGGSIYDKKQDLPYYEYMRSIKRDLVRELGREVAYEEVYALCGFNFDRDFHETNEEYKRFLTFFEKVKGFADDRGYVDSMRDTEVRKRDNTYEQLKNYADKYECAPFDFLVLMTGFKFKKAYIPIDYVSFLSQELKKYYPDGNIEGIRWERPDLYESIRHLRKYLPEQLSMQDVAEFLGVYNKRFGRDSIKTKLSKDFIIQKLNQLCPDRNVSKLREIDLSLYYKVVELSRFEDKTPYQWFIENHFICDNKMSTSRLSKASVDTKIRAAKLLNLRREFLDKFNIETMNDIERYKIAIEMLKNVTDRVQNMPYDEFGVKEVFNKEEKDQNDLQK